MNIPRSLQPSIIAIVDTERDKILLTRYAGGSYRHWALVAGFVEVGETFKGAARREIMEEVGLKVSDLVYYKSQPWSFSDSAMIGFFAKLEGDPSITLQESELGEAVWFSREDVPDLPSTISVGSRNDHIIQEWWGSVLPEIIDTFESFSLLFHDIP